MSRLRAAGPAAGATRRIRAIGIVTLVALAAAVAGAEHWNGRLQEAGFDAYQALAPRRVESMPALVVQVDERSLAVLGQWPWPRTTLARLVREIARHGPAAIGIDLLMPEPDRLSPEQLLKHAEYQEPALARQLAALPSHDEEFARALAVVPSVLGIAGSHEATGMTLRAPPFAVRDAVVGATPGVTRYAAVTTSIDLLDRAAAGRGLLSIDAADTAGGVVRRIPLVFDINGTLAPALAIEMLRVARKAPSLMLLADGGSVRGIVVGGHIVTTEGDGAVRPYYSPRDARRFVAAVDVLDGRVDPERLRDRHVLLATSGFGLVDYRSTPLGLAMPGSEVHAQLLENLYDGTLLVRPRWASAFEAVLVIAAGLLLVYATPVWPPRRAALLAVGGMLMPMVVGFAAFLSHRWLLDGATPSLALGLLYAALLVLALSEAHLRRKTLERQLQRQREREARVAGELAAAQRIQTGMLPRADLLRGDRRLDLAAVMVPAREVGGDLYDYFLLDDRRLFLLIGDVAGKGLPASIFMAISKALYKSATLRMPGAGTGELMSVANDEVSRDNPEALFVTAFAAILDLDTGELGYCNAGHDNPYVLLAEVATPARLSDGDGPPLCVVEGFRYVGGRRRMQRGEVLCLVTDGVTEARDRAGALYGNARLQALLAGCAAAATPPQGVVDAVRASVDAFAGTAEAADDLTVLALRWNGPPDAASA